MSELGGVDGGGDPHGAARGWTQELSQLAQSCWVLENARHTHGWLATLLPTALSTFKSYVRCRAVRSTAHVSWVLTHLRCKVVPGLGSRSWAASMSELALRELQKDKGSDPCHGEDELGTCTSHASTQHGSEEVTSR